MKSKLAGLLLTWLVIAVLECGRIVGGILLLSLQIGPNRTDILVGPIPPILGVYWGPIALLGGYMADRIGPRWVLSSALAIAGFASLVATVFPNPESSNAFTYCLLGGLYASAGAFAKLIAEQFRVGLRPFVLGVAMSPVVLFPAGVMFFLGGQINNSGKSSLFTRIFEHGFDAKAYTEAYGFGLLVVALFVLVFASRLTKLSEPQAREDETSDRLQTLRSPAIWALAIVGTFVWISITSVGQSPLTIGFDRQFPFVEEPNTLATFELCAFAGMLVIGMVGSATRSNWRPALAAGCLAIAAWGAFELRTTPRWSDFKIGLDVFGFFAYGILGTLCSLATQLIPKATRGTVLGVLLLFAFLVCAALPYGYRLLWVRTGIIWQPYWPLPIAVTATVWLQILLLRYRKEPAVTVQV